MNNLNLSHLRIGHAILWAALAMQPTSCSTSKTDVASEWNDVNEERQEAQREARALAEKEKKKYEDESTNKLMGFDRQLAGLRAEAVKASGAKKQDLNDQVWTLDRQILESRADLNSLKEAGPDSWEELRRSLDERFAAIDRNFSDANATASQN